MEDSSIICTKCNAKIKSDSHFCTECGNPVDETQPDNAKVEGVDKNKVQNSLLKSEIRCPQCNHQLNSEDAFCTECGFKIEISSNCPHAVHLFNRELVSAQSVESIFTNTTYYYPSRD